MRHLIAALALLPLPALAQVGPDPDFHLPTRDRAPDAPNPRRLTLPQASSTLSECLATASADPDAAIRAAAAWSARETGSAKAQAELCLGTAYTDQQEWEQAASAFLIGRDAAADVALRARLGEMAGNAALAGGAAEDALAALDTARTDARAAADTALGADVAIDRARALVALNRADEAAAALAEARAAAPNDATAWLLSAALDRRRGRLGEAQAAIETAARLAPTDPQVALEAGRLAVLAGRDAAARADWRSVVNAHPDGAEAAEAKTYLAQLPPAK